MQGLCFLSLSPQFLEQDLIHIQKLLKKHAPDQQTCEQYYNSKVETIGFRRGSPRVKINCNMYKQVNSSRRNSPQRFHLKQRGPAATPFWQHLLFYWFQLRALPEGLNRNQILHGNPPILQGRKGKLGKITNTQLGGGGTDSNLGLASKSNSDATSLTLKALSP